MAVRTKDDLMAAIKNKFGEDSSDDTLNLLEDITDTINDLESNHGTDWKKRFEENDTMWRNKYRDRFYSSDNPADGPDFPDESPKQLNFDDLFK